MPPVPTASAQLLQRRAIQCSFSSVFHLKNAGMNRQDAKFVENIFTYMAGVPIAFMAATAFVASHVQGTPLKTAGRR